MSPVPEGWETHSDDQGRRYYANNATVGRCKFTLL